MATVYIVSFAVIVLLVLLYLDGWGAVIAREPFQSVRDGGADGEFTSEEEDYAAAEQEQFTGNYNEEDSGVAEEENVISEEEAGSGDEYGGHPQAARVSASESSSWAAQASTSYESAFLPPPTGRISNIHPFHSVSPDMCMDAGSGKCLF
jgi:hypothetical protein